MFSFKNLHFLAHLILLLVVGFISIYGHFMNDPEVVLVTTILMVRPMNVIIKKYYGEKQYYIGILWAVLIFFMCGMFYGNAIENNLMVGSYAIMSILLGIGVVEYYIKSYLKK